MNPDTTARGDVEHTYAFDVPATITVHVNARDPFLGRAAIADALGLGVVLDRDHGGVTLHQVELVPGRAPTLVRIGDEAAEDTSTDGWHGPLDENWFGEDIPDRPRMINEVVGHYDTHCYRLVRFYRTPLATWRVTVRRDSYPGQSKAVAELFNRALEWTEIADNPPANWHTTTSLFGEKGTQLNPEPGYATLGRIADDLLAQARLVTGL